MAYSLRNNKLSGFNDSSNENLKFLELSEKIVDFGLKSNVKIKPYVSESLPLFSPLPPEKKKMILDMLHTKVVMLEAAEREGVSFRSNKQVLWHVVKSLGLTPCSDLCDVVNDEDVIEIHWLTDIVQLYHSFSFYEKSSYTLEELCSLPWEELYDTDPQTFANIHKLVDNLITGKYRSTYDPQIPSYVVKEKRSVFLFEVAIEYRLTSPLFDKSGTAVATVSIERLKVIDRKIKAVDEEAQLLSQAPLAEAVPLHSL
jgi:hypothetical protein